MGKRDKGSQPIEPWTPKPDQPIGKPSKEGQKPDKGGKHEKGK
jgi:hypothetical protein